MSLLMRISRSVKLLILGVFCVSCTSEQLMPENLPKTSSPKVVADVLAKVDPEEYLYLFEYDSDAPLDVHEEGRSTLINGTMIKLSYSSPKGGRVPAHLILPRGNGPFPAIIIQHGSLGHKEDLTDLADLFAGYGAASFLIDDPYSRPGGWASTEYMGATWPYYTDQDMDVKIQTIIDLQRAVDYLYAHPQIDPNRLAYLGISYGAAMGAC
jgi:cephalosporin-C deacetylase-like acetyl esterase